MILGSILFLLTLVPENTFGASRDPNSGDPATAQVCYIDFRIDFIVGRTESDFEDEKLLKSTCKYRIEKKYFLELLKPAEKSKRYDGDVRAKVIVDSKIVYFVDRNGSVRLGDSQFVIDRSQCMNLLERVP